MAIHKLTTPIGKAFYPRLQPDYKWDENGQYTCKIHIEDEKEFKEFADKEFRQRISAVLGRDVVLKAGEEPRASRGEHAAELRRGLGYVARERRRGRPVLIAIRTPSMRR